MPLIDRRISLTLISGCGALVSLGCGSGISYEHATVHGKVTYAGKPVPFGSVLFVPVEPPKDGMMQPASGQILADGAYTLKSENDAGAIVGEHKIVVLAVQGDKPVETTPDSAPTPSRSTSAVQFKSAVPKKFSDPTTTPLTRTVKPGDNTIDLDLVD